MLVDFGYAILDSLENEVSEMDNSVMGSGKFGTFILYLEFYFCGILKMIGPKMQDFFPRINMLKEFFSKQSCDELWVVKKCRLSKSIFYVYSQNFFKKKSFKNINLGDQFL